MAVDSVDPIESSVLRILEEYLPNSLEHATYAKPNKLPHVTLTYAQSLDGKISLHPNTRTNISGPETKAMTHYLRTRHDAILVGVGTANADNPGLNSRYSDDGDLPKLESQPRPIILDSTMKWQPMSEKKVLELAKSGLGKAPWWVVNHGEAAKNQHQVKMLRGIGGDVIEVRPRDWNNLLEALGALGIRSLMVEGGAGIINRLLEARNQKYIASIIITLGPSYFGIGGSMINPPRSVEDKKEVTFAEVKWVPMGEDVVMAGRISSSCVNINPASKEFGEPPVSLGWPRGGQPLQEDVSTVDYPFAST